MTTTAGSSTPSSPPPSTASTLWARLLGHRDPNIAQAPSLAQIAPQDKVGTSTRILLHDTHARLEKFSERANLIFSGIEASRREIVRVKEEVEDAREKELDTIAQLSMFFSFFGAYMLVIMCSYNTFIFAPVNRCQSSLQKTIGEPAQAREATMMRADLTVTKERLQTLEENINSKLDALTAHLQAQNQSTRSLQEQFSRAQSQQSRIIELLAPLHPILQSVPLHISIARNAILEKMPECCQCTCTDNCSSRSTTPSRRAPPSMENAEPPLEIRIRKRRRIGLESQHCDPSDSAVSRDQDQPTAVRERQIPHGSAHKPGETPISSRPQSNGTFRASQTPNGWKSGIDTVSMVNLRNVKPGSGNAALATRLSTISDKGNFRIFSSVPVTAVHGKRFILLDNDDDDDDEL